MTETYFPNGTKERTSATIATIDKTVLDNQLANVIDGLNKAQVVDLISRGFTQDFAERYDKWHIRKEAKKFIYLDCGGSGAFLIEIATGEIFNIKGYGTPDYNKKLKANIGNIMTVDPVFLLSKRHNYLR